MINYVTISKFAELSGYTQKAIRQKKAEGVWPSGLWVAAPDGRILINIERYERWVETDQGYEKPANQLLKSTSITEVNAAKSDSNSSPRPLT